MLAARAARLVRGGGGAREIVVFWVVGAEGGVVGSEKVRNNNRCIVVGSWLLRVRPLDIAMASGYVSLSTGSLRRKIGRSSGMLAFIFVEDVVPVKRRRFIVFRWKGGFAIGNGNRHGGGISDQNSYENSRSLVYHSRGTAGRCLLSKL